MTPWNDGNSYEAEPEPKHFDGVRELSGWIIAACIVLGLLIYGICAVV